MAAAVARHEHVRAVLHAFFRSLLVAAAVRRSVMRVLQSQLLHCLSVYQPAAMVKAA